MTDIRFAKFVVLINALVPGALLAWDAFHDGLGVDPINFSIHTTGMLALIFIGLTLLVTPLRRLTGFSELYHFRRMLGLYAFFYALAHFAIYVGLAQGMQIGKAFSEIWNRWYLLIGFTALLLMVPLAVTSTNAMLRWMGPKAWKGLHRLMYITAILGVIHYYMEVKSDIRIPLAFAIVIGVLLAYRVVMAVVDRVDAKTGLPARVDPRWSGQLRVEKITQETPDVRTFRLIPADGGALPFAYLPGQYLTLELMIDGKNVQRSYTMASTPSRPGAVELTIKRNLDGVSSRYMHERVREGELVSVMAPSGQFTFVGEEVPGIVLLAGGVGITPLMSIIRYLTDKNWPGQIYLLYSNQTIADVIFREEIEGLKSRHSNFHATFTLSRGGEDGWTGETGRIDAALLKRLVPALATMPVFICGPSEMLKEGREMLRGLGVPEEGIRTESFGTSSSRVPSADGRTFSVTFAVSGQTVEMSANRTILEVAEELGLPAKSECRSGICGTCKCKMVSGSVSMATEEALSAVDKRGNLILLCQAQPTSDVVVEI